MPVSYVAPSITRLLFLSKSPSGSGTIVELSAHGLVCIRAGQAMAAHNSGGMVIVQVERVVESGTLPPRCVHLPAALVDKARRACHLISIVVQPWTIVHSPEGLRSGW